MSAGDLAFDERRTPGTPADRHVPQPPTATTAALQTGAVAGAAAGAAVRAVNETAQNGLTGFGKILANVSAVGFVFIITYVMYRDMANGQREERALFRDSIREQRESDSRLREAQNAEIRAFATEFRAGMTEFRAMVREQRMAQPPHREAP